MCVCGVAAGWLAVKGGNVLECFSLPDVLRHTWVRRGRRWSVCPAWLVDQVHSPLEQWVVGESGLLHASSMDFSLAEAHDNLYAGWDQGSSTHDRTGLGWAGLDGIEQVQKGPEQGRTSRRTGENLEPTCLKRHWVASSELKSLQVAQETLFSRAPLQCRTLTSGKQTCSLSQPSPTQAARLPSPFPPLTRSAPSLSEGGASIADERRSCHRV